jgi:dTDP-4-amino-4,6-dideoxygalactose transaminase
MNSETISLKDQLAINGGPKTINKSFSWPIFDQDDVQAVAEVVASGAWGNPDCKGLVEKFEKEFAAYCGSKYAITCVNGSVALRLALMACVPVFVDIDPETYNMNPTEVEKAITSKTKAIIPVHFAGQACDMDAIMAIAKKHKLRVIEDAAHAHGGAFKGKKLGSIGDAGCFSFQSSKNLTSGEGGLVVTDDEALYDMMNSLRNVGRVKGGQWYEHHNLGCNYRITQLQAALLSKQLSRLEDQTRKRDKNGVYLNGLLEKIDGIAPLTRGHGETLHTYHIYIFKYDKSKFGGLSKREFAAMLAAEGVPSFMGYPEPLYKQPLFQKKNFMCYAIPEEVDYTNVCCPETEKACYEDAVWIMQHTMLGTKEDMDLIAQAILKIQAAVNE